MLPYTHLPKRLIIELVYRNVFWTNSFTSKGGISKTQSPRSIVTGIEINYKDHCQLEFGEYVHTHEEHDNSMQPRTIGALALRPTGNAQGGHFFLSLHTGRVINRRQRAWTRLPMPQEVINQVHRLARRNNAPPGLTFQDRHNVVTPEDYNDVDDETYVPDINDETSEDQNPDTESDQEELSDEQAEESNKEEEEEIEISEESTVEENEDSEEKSEHSGSEEGEQPESNEEGIEDEEDSTSENEEQSEQNNANNLQTDDDSDSDDEPDDNNDEDNNMIERKLLVGHQLRRQKKIDYNETRQYKSKTISPGHTSVHTVLTNIDYSQYGLKKGLRIFGNPGADAVKKEVEQLDYMDVMEPKHPHEMTRQERQRSLHYLMFLKQKRCGKIKGRGCVDGRPQREYTNKEESSSPTVYIESVFITSTIEAKEERDVATVDIPGAFMQTEQEGTVHVKLEGVMVRLLMKVNPGKYDNQVQWFNGKPVLYAKLKKALYGTLQAALLFWKSLSTKLKHWGFEINPYDWCVANKIIDNKQCTITWHVDDLKISHVNKDVVSIVIQNLKDEYGKHADLSIMRGKVHIYLGMTIDFTQKRKITFSMMKYIKDMIEEAPDNM